MENEKKIYLFGPLGTVTAENVESVFEKLYSEWLYKESDEVTVNGQKVDGFERALLRRPDENGNPNMKTVEVSGNMAPGMPLSKATFIEEEIKRLEPKHQRNIGSPINRINNQKIKIYLDFLKKQPKEKETKAERKHTGKAYAIAYILDLQAEGQAVPRDPSERYKKNDIEAAAKVYGCPLTENTFYKAVKEIEDQIIPLDHKKWKGYERELKPAIKELTKKKSKVLKLIRKNPQLATLLREWGID